MRPWRAGGGEEEGRASRDRKDLVGSDFSDVGAQSAGENSPTLEEY